MARGEAKVFLHRCCVALIRLRLDDRLAHFTFDGAANGVVGDPGASDEVMLNTGVTVAERGRNPSLLHQARPVRRRR